MWSPSRFTMPGSALPFDLPARAPYGRSMIVALITTEPLSLLESAADGKTATLAAASLAGIQQGNEIATRSFGAEARTQGRAAWAGVAITEVCSTDGRCR